MYSNILLLGLLLAKLDYKSYCALYTMCYDAPNAYSLTILTLLSLPLYTPTSTHMPAQDPMLVVNEIIEVITDRNPTFNHYPGVGAFVLR